MSGRDLAVVTGASSGIGRALAHEAAQHDFDVVMVADEPEIEDAAAEVRALGCDVTSLQADLATFQGVEDVVTTIRTKGAPVGALLANAGVGVSGPFIETDLDEHLRLVQLNVVGAVHLAHRVLPSMVANRSGRVLFTSSVVANIPGPYMSTYSGSKAFLFSFAEAIRLELEDTGVTVTALMPGATDTKFFERADMEDTKLGQADKDDAEEVAHEGFEAMLAGRDHVVPGSLKNRVQAAAGKILPGSVTAKANKDYAKPGSAD
jgi:short-subunit dehydrogenase